MKFEAKHPILESIAQRLGILKNILVLKQSGTVVWQVERSKI